MKVKLRTQTSTKSGNLVNEYKPLQNLVGGEYSYFDTDKIQFDLNHPLEIECQPSYDNSVNIIMTDDKNPPLLINSAFSVKENNTFEIVDRNQTEPTNIYKEDELEQQSMLFRNLKKIPRFELNAVTNDGSLKGGNYIFYLRLADGDYNKSDVVAESSIVSIFNGDANNIKNVTGTLMDECTDKSIKFKITDIDITFSKIYLSYKRAYSDLNGILMEEYCEFIEPYKVDGETFEIVINGYERTNIITESDLNIQYNVYDAVKTQAQTQNMLFFGNVQEPIISSIELQQLSYKIQVKCIQKENSIGFVSTRYEVETPDFSEYYNPKNIYYYLGYWPEEYYRLGVVFIFQNDSLSPVYNLLGTTFKELNKYNFDAPISDAIDVSDIFVGSDKKYNTRGVFKLPEAVIQKGKSTKPLGFKFNISDIKNELKEYKIKGLFFVRQARIPTILAQGLSMGIIDGTSTPALYDTEVGAYFTECFDSLKHKGCKLKTHDASLEDGYISKNGPECLALRQFERRVCYSNGKGCYNRNRNNYESSGINPYPVSCRSLLCVDAYLNKSLQTIFDGSKFHLKKFGKVNLQAVPDSKQRLFESNVINLIKDDRKEFTIAYMPEHTPIRIINKKRFSSQCGSAEKPSNIRSVHYKYFNDPDEWGNLDYNPNDDWFVDFVRGNFTSYLAILEDAEENRYQNEKGPLEKGCLYNIYNYDTEDIEVQIENRANDKTSFVRISDRYLLNDWNPDLEVFGGDCFTNTVSVKMLSNFIDSSTPTNEIIVDNHLFHNMVGDKDSEDIIIISKKEGKYRWIVKPSVLGWEKAQMGDWNAVDLGHWVTYKCLSNFNLGLRVENSQYVDEKAKMGTNRSFYPMTGGNVSASTKVKDSDLLNAGLSTTLSARKYFEYQDLPYTKSMFDNRIAFSNVQIEDDFRNAYKIFQGMAYNDIERQYGSIVKLLEYGTDLFCVFEHGCAIIPINEKALMQTTTGQSVHMYGAGVLPEKVTPVSTDYGSTWQESIIKTANGIYGVDAHAKKIWRFNAKGFSIISDTLVQRFLNDNILLTESDIQPTVGFKNIKTHYNAYKNDVMFTFYKGNKVWNLCYNERIEKWTTKYSWTPLYSENINNRFVSVDRERDKIYSFIYNNKNTEKGLRIVERYGDKKYPIGCLLDLTNDYVNSHEQFDIVGYDNVAYIPKIKQIQIDYIENNEIKTKLIESGFEHDTNNRTSKCSELNIEISVLQDKKYFIQSKIESQGIKLLSTIINLDLIYEDITLNENLGFIVNYDTLSEEDKILYDSKMRNGLFIHGRSGVYDEINYFDCDLDNQIKPTFWYNKQEPFEFEFVVNQPTGIHKIFNNLVMISNNVEPDSLEIEIVGDVYGFDKEAVYKNENCEEHNHSLPKTEFVKMIPAKDKYYKTNVTWDPILNQYLLKTHQDVLNINDYGRRIGNIQYKEDVWYVTLQPIYHKLSGSSRLQSTRIRDKFARIRIKYKGDKLVIIHAIQTLANVSYS